MSQFRFDTNWILEAECGKLIEATWSFEIGDLISKLSKISDILKTWSRSNKIEGRKTSNSLKQKIVELEDADPNDDNLTELPDVKIALNMKADKELFWE
ncbi:hypothetical protein HRI_001690600 [Hibiscus trionum]|uniref:Uncharacterized protein n=1 Tax=Hibiscus trionum TaxID=183268 RepID=A0A9W7HNY7_HIBTR|nr:hypothetical protein HRI_001690600 [Hibiscus trionum]